MKRSRSFVKSALGLAILFGVLSIVAVVILINSTPYELSRDFLESNPDVRKEFGQVHSISWAPFDGASILGEEAEFAFKVVGESRRATVYLELEKEGGQWTVTKARLRGISGGYESLAVD